MNKKAEPVYYATPKQSAHQLLLDCLADAEAEVMKLRRLLVKKLCDCRTCSLNLPLEPSQHRLTCLYRREMS